MCRRVFCKFFNSIRDFFLVEVLFLDKKLNQFFFVWFSPLKLNTYIFDFFRILLSQEQFSRFFIREIFRYDIFWLVTLGGSYFSFYGLQDVLYCFMLLNVFEGLYLSNSCDGRSVIAATKNAKIDKLLVGYLEASQDFI